VIRAVQRGEFVPLHQLDPSIDPALAWQKGTPMGGSVRLTTDRYPAASLGCGTLIMIIIALIVWVFSNAGSQQTAVELTSLRK